MLDCRFETFSLRECDAAETHGIASLELTHLPTFGFHDDCGAHEAAKAGSVRAKQNGHVPGEINGADSIGIVVNVRGMKASFTSIFTCPLGLWSDETHAGAIRLIMNLPVGGEEHVNVCWSEELGFTVRPVENSDLPLACVLRSLLQWKAAKFRSGNRRQKMNHVSCA